MPNISRRHLARLWLHRRLREVALAVMLTVAAAGFMTLALLRGDTVTDRASYAAGRKPATP